MGSGMKWRLLGEVGVVLDGESERIAGKRQRAVAGIPALAASNQASTASRDAARSALNAAAIG